MDEEITFLKLGGSLITDKDIPFSARKQTIKRLGLEIIEFLKAYPDHKLLIGHGSGSFGHSEASEFNTIKGVHTRHDWQGFQSVWWAAHQLNQIVCELLIEIGLPIVSLPASSSLVTNDRSITKFTSYPILSSLEKGLVPVIFGDVIFDKHIGGTILSTEEIFAGLISQIQPKRILLAGKDPGVYKDFPKNQHLLETITPKSYQQEIIQVGKSESMDVTGGMAAKVKEMLILVQQHNDLEVQIFSGNKPTNLLKCLSGQHLGTIISVT